MTITRTQLGTDHGRHGLSRSSEISVSAMRITEGIWLERIGQSGRLTICAHDGSGKVTSISIDVTRADLRHVGTIAIDLADIMDREA